MQNQNDGRIGNFPANINKVNPIPNDNASEIVKVVKNGGKITGYELSDGSILSKEAGVDLAKKGGIAGVSVASRNGSEYLRTLPDGRAGNNLDSLPIINQ